MKILNFILLSLIATISIIILCLILTIVNDKDFFEKFIIYLKISLLIVSYIYLRSYIEIILLFLLRTIVKKLVKSELYKTFFIKKIDVPYKKHIKYYKNLL